MPAAQASHQAPIGNLTTASAGTASANGPTLGSPPAHTLTLGQRMLIELQTALGDAWHTTLNADERQLAADVMNDLATFAIDGLVYGAPLAAELAQLEAQIRGIGSIEFDRTKHYVMAAAGRAIGQGLAWIAKDAGPYVPAIAALISLL